jgi:hypothetical protein
MISRIAFVAIMLCTQCTVKYKFNDADTGDAKTISVDLFNNESAQAPPAAAQQFTEGLRDMFQSQTKLDLISSGADLKFSGSIIGYAVSPVGIQNTDQAALNRLTITVKVEYINQLEENKSFTQNFTRFSDYESSQQLSDVEATLLADIFEQINQDIFNRALSNW